MNNSGKDKPAIYVFSTAYDPFIGGAEIAVSEIASRLFASFDFFVITARFNPRLPKHEKKNGTTIIRVGLGSRYDKYLLPIWGTFAVLKLMRRHPPALFWGVMVTFASGIPYIVNLFRRRNKIPIVLTLQEGDPETHLQKSRLGLIGLAWGLALRRASRITAISSYLADLAKRFGYGGEVLVIPNGVSIDKFAHHMTLIDRQAFRASIGMPADAHMIVSISRLVRKNGLDTAIFSLTHLPPALKAKTYLVLVGGGGEESFLRSTAEENGVSSMVIFAGERPHDDAMKYLSAADIFVRPSRSEGMGNSFIEAMAARIPVIGTPVGGILDFLFDRETGLVAKPDDPKSLAVAVDAMISNSGLCKNMADKAFDLVSSRYNWEKIAKSYHEVFADEIKRASYPQVLIATGIYPPEIGGTAGYAEKLKEILSAGRWRIEVLSYGESPGSWAGVHRVSRRAPTGIRHLLAFFHALPLVRRSDAVILLDHFSMGFPAGLAAFICRRPYMLRIGGDFLWESHVEKERAEITLPVFYGSLSFTIKERVIFYLARFVLRRAGLIVFSTDWQRRIFLSPYGLAENRTVVLQNAVDAVTFAPRLPKTRSEIIYAGRLLFLKNLRRAILAFREFKMLRGGALKMRLIGEGPEERQLRTLLVSYGLGDCVSIEPPMPRLALLETIKAARAVIVPSFSDISPNLALEALAAGIPAILTRCNGYGFNEADGVLLVEPLEDSSFLDAYRRIASPAAYKKLKGAAAKAVFPAWEDLGKQYVECLSRILNQLK